MVPEPGRPRTSANRPVDNLPTRLTAFIGRERDIAEIRCLLPATRLLTLSGPGGVGKTRLAIEVARSLLDAYPDGAWEVDLGPVRQSRLVPQVVAGVLAVREVPGQPLEETLAEVLCPRYLLMVLDNCEHLLAACASLSDALLRACPRSAEIEIGNAPKVGDCTFRLKFCSGHVSPLMMPAVLLPPAPFRPTSP